MDERISQLLLMYLPHLYYVENRDTFCLSLRYIEFPSHFNYIFILFPWKGCHPQGLSPDLGAPMNPQKPPLFHSNLILAFLCTTSPSLCDISSYQLGKGRVPGENDWGREHTHKHLMPSRCPQWWVKSFPQRGKSCSLSFSNHETSNSVIPGQC